MANLNEYILCAAVLHNGTVVSGYRHKDCSNVITKLTGKVYFANRETQGFLTSKNRFVYRKEAYQIAKANNQLLISPSDDPNMELTSEELYNYMENDEMK